MKIFNVLFSCLILLSSSISIADTLTISKSYVRETPPHAKNSAAFMVISNNSNSDIKLISATSDISSRVELHNHINEDGLMKMRQVKEILIAANDSTALQPGGYHVMFIGLKEALKENNRVAIKLYFDNGDEVIVQAPIKKIMSHKK